MNIRQRVVILIATIVIFIMGVFPPYQLSGDKSGLTKFGFLFVPPAQSHKSVSSWTYNTRANLDITRLYIQWILVILVAVGLALFFQDPKKSS